MQYQIPKRIIQTGKSLDQPLRNRAAMSNVRLLNPDYEYLFFDDEGVEKFVQQEFPEYREVYDSFQFPIQRFDFFRYLAVYHYGGFYFDLDVLLSSGLSDLLDAACVFPFEGITLNHFLRNHFKMDWEIGNYAFGAAAGHPFLQAVIENCVKAQKDPEWLKPMMHGLPPLFRTEFLVLNTTGPGLISRTLAENTELAETVTVLFPPDVCDVRSWNCFGDLGIHLMDGTWRTKSSFLHRRVAQYWERWLQHRVLKKSKKLGPERHHPVKRGACGQEHPSSHNQECLVSILIPAFNAEESIADTIRSAIGQTWKHKEIIVVDDGSSDQTLAIARQFESQGVRVVTQQNRGATHARNNAFALSRGEYIQWLDADDLLAPNKISKQMQAMDRSLTKRTLISSAWGIFMYRYYRARFTSTALWCNLSPTEWLLRKMEQNVYMQTATWLVSRELTEAAGLWDTRLLGDDDGEYFCRVLLASDGVHFVPDSKVYYRGPGLAFLSLSYIGQSTLRIDAHWLSMQLHIGYLRSLEDSERVRSACIEYLQTSLHYFYPERPDIFQEAERLAGELGGKLESPRLSWKYAWIKTLFGWRIAKRIQRLLLGLRWAMGKRWDKTLFRITGRRPLDDMGV
jgi:glycosyltransferase involved in cell wall biosynthesis